MFFIFRSSFFFHHNLNLQSDALFVLHTGAVETVKFGTKICNMDGLIVTTSSTEKEIYHCYQYRNARFWLAHSLLDLVQASSHISIASMLLSNPLSCSIDDLGANRSTPSESTFLQLAFDNITNKKVCTLSQCSFVEEQPASRRQHQQENNINPFTHRSTGIRNYHTHL